METRGILRTVITGLVGIGLLILVIVVVVKIIGSFSGGSSTSSQVNIGKYVDTNSQASLLVDDPTNNDQDHRQLKIMVSNTTVEADVIQGYEGTIIDSRTYVNNSAAYGAFLQSLKLMNFAKGSTSSVDYRGYCPTGERFLYSFNDGSKDLFNYWSTSCGQGTFGGSGAAVRQLFYRQILESDFSKLTGSLSLGV